MARVIVTATIPGLADAVRNALGPAVEREANRRGKLMVSTVEGEVGKYKSRPAKRRRYPGSTHITTGWDYKVVGDPRSTPIFVNLIARGDSNYIQRIHFLNDGTPPHQIRSKQSRTAGGQFGRTPWLRFPEGGGVDGPPWAYAKKVNHPGHTGDHFIEKAVRVVGGSGGSFT